MNQVDAPLAPPPSGWRTFWRLLKYTLLKAIKLAVLLVIGIYMAVVVLNLGGFVDQISRANIDSANLGLSLDMAQEHKSPEEIRDATAAQTIMLTEAYGLNRPFLLRCLDWTIKGLTFDWGVARTTFAMTGEPGQQWQVSQIVKERLALTLVLSGFANLLVFISSIFVALSLARNYGSRKDRLFSLLSLVSAVPSWVYGLVLVIIFSKALKWLPAGGFLDITTGFSDRDRVQLFLSTSGVLATVLNFGKHLILPAMAIFLALFFQSVYTWRIYFQLQVNEDYMELARAKGLPDRRLERQYLLRPALPAIITSFALILVTFWESSIALEYFFGYPGIGNLFISSVHAMDRSLSLAIVIVFAFLLAATVFVLDFVYVLVDPRLRLGFDAATLRPVRRRQPFWKNLAKGLREPPVPAPSQGSSHGTGARPRSNPFKELHLRSTLGEWLHQLRGFSGELFQYNSAKIGLALILLVAALSIYTVIAIPYEASVRLFRTERSEKYQLPETAQPAWTNFFRKNKLPDTRIYSTDDPEAQKSIETVKGETQMFTYTLSVDYPYQDFPQDVVVRFETNDQLKLPFISKMVWVRPDGSEVDFGRFSTATRAYSFSYMESAKNDTIVGGKGSTPPMKTLFMSPEDLETMENAPKETSPEAAASTSMPSRDSTGSFGRLHLRGKSGLDVELVLLGKVYGLAGTDNERRDLSALLFLGAPITLTFGLLGAVGTTLASMLLAAAAVWKGGWLDETIQRITDLKIILPTLPFAIMVYFLYSKSVWVILGVIILLSIFGAGLKITGQPSCRSKNRRTLKPRAYGTPNTRIITRYLVPRILPLMIPQIVLLVPTYVFLEATLAFMGVSDLLLPTWGRIMLEALVNGAMEGHYYWALEPGGAVDHHQRGLRPAGFRVG